MKFSAEEIIKLLQVKGIGKGKIMKLSDMMSNIVSDDETLADIIVENTQALKITSLTKGEILASFEKGRELYELSLEKNIRIITIADKEYPKKLKDTTNPPIILNVLGNLEALNNMPCFAVIGTRTPSAYGKQIGERIGFLLGENKINVISGLAIGCDTAGHIGSLRAKGVTTAVLAHGLDSIYPKENSGLAQAILENNGCLISEYLIKTRGLPNFFVERDRIQAGLSDGTFVVETDIKGGTMHTVGFTKEYKRILSAFYHPIDKRNDKSRGNEKLIASGDAIKIETTEDIDNLIRRLVPVSQNIQEHTTPFDAIQLPVFNLDELVDKEYQLAKKKTKKKSSKSPKKKGDKSIQAKINDEWTLD